MRKLLCVTLTPTMKLGDLWNAVALSRARVETLVVCMTAGTPRAIAALPGPMRSSRLYGAPNSRLVQNAGHNARRGARLSDGKLDRVDLTRLSAISCCAFGGFARSDAYLGPMAAHRTHRYAMAGTFATLAFEWADVSIVIPNSLSRESRRIACKSCITILPTSRCPIASLSRHDGHCAHRDRQGALREETSGFQQHITQKPLFDRVRKSFSQRWRHGRDVSPGGDVRAREASWNRFV